MGEIIFCILLLLGGVLLFLQTLEFKTVKLIDPIMGPARFPQIVIGILIVSLVALLIIKLVKKDKKSFVFLELFKGAPLWFGLMMLGYILILVKVGFIVSTSLFLIVATTYLYYVRHKAFPIKRLLVQAACIVACTVGLYFLFTRLMGVILPRGDIFSAL